MYSVGAQVPVYYRIMPDDIKDVKSFSLCFKELGIKDATPKTANVLKKMGLDLK
ncbi:MAG: hypothetical protein LKK16_05825 [Bacteroidales bacterium]|nr:hypothetical protein [Bacteroidales bacterium]MCI2135824.1 hypothetical protein [Bacteroidales bacterium]MCI5720664.1 hypothetical protein [Bacteroidales bacterium]